jgi:phosphonate transport system permease protein
VTATAAGAAGLAAVERVARRPRISANKVIASIVLLAMAGYAVWSLTQIDFSLYNFQRSLLALGKTISLMDPISFPSVPDLVYLISLTLGVVIAGTVVAAVISVPVAYLAAVNTAPARWARVLGRAIGVVTRAVPDVILAMAVSLMFTLGATWPGVIAIGFHSIGMISKLFADAVEQIDEGPRIAVRAAGGSKAQEFWSGVFPQVFPSWVATTLHRFDINLRGSVILGYAGVGGLGYRMNIDFQQFPQGFGPALGIAIVIFLLCVVTEIISSAIRVMLLGAKPTRRTIGDSLMRGLRRDRAARGPAVRGPAVRGQAKRASATLRTADLTVDGALRRPWIRARLSTTVWAWVGILVVVAGFAMSDLDPRQITWSYVWSTFMSFWPPSPGAYDTATFVTAIQQTLEMAFAAALLTFLFSLVFGSLAARNIAPSPWVRGTFRVFLVVFRGVPELVLAIVLIIVTGLGPEAGVLALAFGGIGLLGKLIADSFEEVDPGPEQAVRATGAGRLQVFSLATLPQGLPSLLGNTLYLLDTNIRAATVLGIVGAGGIGYYLTVSAGLTKTHPVVSAIIGIIVAMVLVVEGIASYLRHTFK